MAERITTLLVAVGDLIGDADLLGVTAAAIGVVLLWTGVAKLRRPRDSAVALVDFGITAQVRPVMGLLQGLVELGLGILWILGLQTPYVATASSALFVFFCIVIWRSLRAGEVVHCNCFGDQQSVVSRVSLLRAAILAALAFTFMVAPVAPADPQILALRAIGGGAIVFSIALLDAIVHARGRPERDSDYIEFAG